MFKKVLGALAALSLLAGLHQPVQAANIKDYPTVAVMNFGNKAVTSRGLREHDFSSATEYAIYQLSACGWFDLVDYEELSTIAKMHSVNMSGLIDPATTVAMGKFAGAKFMVVGNVTGLTTKENVFGYKHADKGSISNAQHVVTANVAIRIVDIETGRIVVAGLGKGSSTSTMTELHFTKYRRNKIETETISDTVADDIIDEYNKNKTKNKSTTEVTGNTRNTGDNTDTTTTDSTTKSWDNSDVDATSSSKEKSYNKTNETSDEHNIGSIIVTNSGSSTPESDSTTSVSGSSDTKTDDHKITDRDTITDGWKETEGGSHTITKTDTGTTVNGTTTVRKQTDETTETYNKTDISDDSEVETIRKANNQSRVRTSNKSIAYERETLDYAVQIGTVVVSDIQVRNAISKAVRDAIYGKMGIMTTLNNGKPLKIKTGF